MSTVYRERISDARLRAVADHVRAWLFPPPEEGKPEVNAATEVAAAAPASE
jgi:hypothetical protein